MKTIIESLNRINPVRYDDPGSRFWLNRLSSSSQRNSSLLMVKFPGSFFQQTAGKRYHLHRKRNILSSAFFTASALSLGFAASFLLIADLQSNQNQVEEIADNGKENRTSVPSAIYPVYPVIQNPLKSCLIRHKDLSDPSALKEAEQYSRDLFSETLRLQKLLANTDSEISKIRFLKMMKSETADLNENQDLFCPSDYLENHLLQYKEHQISQSCLKLEQTLNAAQLRQRSLFETYETASLQESFVLQTSAGPNAEDMIQNTDSLKLLETEGEDDFADAGGIGSAGSDSDETLFEKACPAVFDGLDGFVGSSGSLMLPASGPISAGTWSYPGGGMHLGMDLAVGMYTPLRAPADGVILYASAPVSSNCGYLGNTCGWPYGGGNTLCMLAVTDDQLYAVSLCHLSNDIRVSAGMRVSQGDVLALSGNSGNSSGPHTHIEVFALRTDLQSAASYFKNNGADFSFGCGWSAPATCSGIACRIRPESVF